jgi:hypothetical protein
MDTPAAWPLRTIAALVAGLLVTGCSGESGPAFIAGQGYAETIEISTHLGPTPVLTVGAPLVLHARRTSGPWVQADLTTVSSSCWWAAPPPSVEPEVADNIRWISSPEAPARFNLDLRPDRTREVRFSEPGTYVLEARSTLTCWEHAAVDSLVVQVVPND